MMIVQINDDSTITIEKSQGRIPCRISGKYVQPHELNLKIATADHNPNFGCRWDLINDPVAAEIARVCFAEIQSTPAYKDAVQKARELSYNEHDRKDAKAKAIHVDELIGKLTALKNQDAQAHVLISSFGQDEQFCAFAAEFKKLFSHDGSNFYELNAE